MNGEREAQILQAAKLYYELDMTQDAIARQLDLTRWTVGRLLREAKSLGIVRIEVVSPAGRQASLEAELQRRYGLRDAVVLSLPVDDDRVARDVVARAAAEYLEALRPPLLAVSWGRTMASMAEHITYGWNEGVEIVSTNGSTSRSTVAAHATRVAEDLAQAGPGSATLLPVPAILGERSTREALERDSVIGQVLDMARAAPVCCYSLGALGADSVLVDSGYLTTGDMDRLAELGAVGDVLGRFVAETGEIVDPELDFRTLGLTVEELGEKERSIVVAAGAAKRRVVHAMLRCGAANVLITDEITAGHALEAAA